MKNKNNKPVISDITVNDIASNIIDLKIQSYIQEYIKILDAKNNKVTSYVTYDKNLLLLYDKINNAITDDHRNGCKVIAITKLITMLKNEYNKIPNIKEII